MKDLELREMGRKRELTERQKAVLCFIQECRVLHKAPPTVREIASSLNIRSTGSVSAALGALEKKGYLCRQPGLARGIRLTRRRRLKEAAEGVRTVPILPLPDSQEAFWDSVPTGSIRLEERLATRRQVAAMALPENFVFGGLPVSRGYLIIEKKPLRFGEAYAFLVDGSLAAGPVLRTGNSLRLYDFLTGEEVLLSLQFSRNLVLGRVLTLICRF